MRPCGTARLAALAAAAGLALAPATAPGARGGEPKPGDYCPIPEPGETPECLVGAREEFSEFFVGLEAGALSDQAAARLESELRQGAEAPRPYEALSSLAYGYFLLARRSADSGQLDARTAARLERWNDLLARAWRESGDDPRFREALRAAASDIKRRAPPLGLRCTDALGEPARCDSTEAVLRAMGAARDRVGIRGQLARLLERLFPDSDN